MSYPRDLDEYTQAELEHEILRRTAAQENDFCDYCNRECGTLPVCKFPYRHSGHIDEPPQELLHES